MNWIWFAAGVLVGRSVLRQREISAINPEGIKGLTRQAARWSVAGAQDMNPMIGLMHANYGRAYADALRNVATSQDIRRYAGVDIRELERKATTIQDNAMRRMGSACPAVIPEGKWLVRLAGEGL
jgi:hypothetical protein